MKSADAVPAAASPSDELMAVSSAWCNAGKGELRAIHAGKIKTDQKRYSQQWATNANDHQRSVDLEARMGAYWASFNQSV
jgi:hypothetical protein